MLLYEVDFFAFMGQSNMAGRGIAEQAPAVPQGHGYEFRAISDPTTLHPITEPFGKDENLLSGIYEPGMKTGSLVSAFVNSCYQQTGLPKEAPPLRNGLPTLPFIPMPHPAPGSV